MISRNLTIVKHKVRASWFRIKPRMKEIVFKTAFLLLLVILITQQELSFQFKIGGNEQTASIVSVDEPKASYASNVQQAGFLPIKIKWWNEIKEKQNTLEGDLNLANAATAVGAALTEEQQKQAAKYSNLGLVINPNYAEKHGISEEIVQFKKQKCLGYIFKYQKMAKEEADIYGIPVAITLAQGLLESNAGDSKLAKNDNNHFGIKCKTKCLGCRCANYTDDSKYDMFRVFDSPWYSFREHSKLLTGKRYKHLLSLPKTDYKNWARGLQAAGYATDTKYADKLIKIIESLQLYRFDL